MTLPVARFGFPGALRDRLVAAIVRGDKTTTTALLVEFEVDGEPLPEPGLLERVVDSGEQPVAVIETTGVRTVRLADIDLEHVLGEGEGYGSVAQWRTEHERLWHSGEMRSALGMPEFTVDDDTIVVAQRFRVRELLAGSSG